MKHLNMTLGLIAAMTFVACSPSKTVDNNQPATLDLNKNVSAEATAPLAVADLSFVQLSNDTVDAFFKNATILDVAGDTVILLENNPMASRLIMYSLTDGSYLGQISHQGQGPGEYARIIGAFVDGSNGTVLLPDFHTPAVNVYALASDSLVNVLSREFVPSVITPTGGVESCINVACPTPDGLDIIQYDRTYAIADSISVPGFRGGNFSTLWLNAGTQGVFMIGDTIYTLTPGELNPIAIAPRGDMAITPDNEDDIMMELYSGADDIEVLKPYILIRDIQLSDGKMLITTMTDAKKHSDLYDLNNGRLIYRNTYQTLDKPSMIVVDGDGHKALQVERLFAKNGRWYGIVSEDTAGEINGIPTADTNCAIVTFNL